MKNETYKGVAILRHPGAIIVRVFIPEKGPIMRRVEVAGGVQVTLGKEVYFERLGAAYVLTGGG